MSEPEVQNEVAEQELPENWFSLKGFDEECEDQVVRFYEKYPDGTTADGTTLEAMIQITLDRLLLLNDRFPCDENKKAIAALKEARHQLNERTRNRVARGVEGQHVA